MQIAAAARPNAKMMMMVIASTWPLWLQSLVLAAPAAVAVSLAGQEWVLPTAERLVPLVCQRIWLATDATE